MKTKTFFSRMVWDTSQLLRKSLTSLKALTLLLVMLMSVNLWAADTVDDVLTASDFEATTTNYTDFSDVSKTSDAVYAGQSAKTNSGGIQLRSKNSNSGIISTTSGGTVSSISIVIESGTPTVDVYGSNTAYTTVSELYDTKTQGTKLGSLTSDKKSITVDGSYKYVGIRSNSGAIYLTSVTISWAKGGGTVVPVTGVTLDNTSANVKQGGSLQLTATVAPDNATNKKVSWSVSGNSKVHVSNSGLVTIDNDAIKNSTATVTVTTEDQSKQASCTITVVENKDKELTFGFTSTPTGWPSAKASAAAGEYTYTLNSVDYKFTHTKVGDGIYGSSYLMVVKGNALGLPILSGYKLTKVVATNSGGCSQSVEVAVSKTTSSTTATDVVGASQTWSTKSSTYTYDLTGTTYDTRYYVVVSSANAQITGLTLYYEPKPTVTGISIAQAPSKVDYKVGEKFDPTGLQISVNYGGVIPAETVIYNNDTKAGFTFNPALTTGLAVTDTKVAVSYDGKSADQAITVTRYTTEIIADDEKEIKVGDNINLTDWYTITDGYNGTISYASNDDETFLVFDDMAEAEKVGSAILTITAPQTAKYEGTSKQINVSIISASAPQLSVDETELEWSNIPVGESGEGKVLTISGDNLAGDITLAIEGTDAGQFLVTPTSIAQAEAIGEVTVTYSPTLAGDHSATLKISSANATTLDVALTGNALAKYTVKWSINGYIDETKNETVIDGNKVTVVPSAESCDEDNIAFLGWTNNTIADAAEAPTILFTDVASAPAVTDNITYYAVFAEIGGTGEMLDKELTTAEFDTWTVSSSNTSQESNYRKLSEGGWVETTEFDLSKITKIVVYGGTYGGSSNNKLNIKDANGNLWKAVTVSGDKQTGVNTYTGGNALSGTGKIRVISGSTSVRVSKVIVYTQEKDITYSHYSTTCVPPLVAPTIETAAGEYCTSVDVVIAKGDNPTEATLQYSVDNGANWNTYSSLNLTATTTVKARVILDPKTSAEAEATYTILTHYSDLTALKATATADEVKKACVSFSNLLVNATNVSTVYLTDGTNIYMINKNNHGFSRGQKLSTGEHAILPYKLYNGVLQFNDNAGITVSSSDNETPATTMAVNAITASNYGQLVKIENVIYVADGAYFKDGSDNKIKLGNNIVNASSWVKDGAIYDITGIITTQMIEEVPTLTISPRVKDLDVVSKAEKLNAPSNLTYENLTGSSVTLKWGEVTGAAKYDVEVYDGSTRVKNNQTTSLSYGPTGLTSGKTYTWRVRSVGDDLTTSTSDWTDGTATFTTLQAAKLVWMVNGEQWGEPTYAVNEKVVMPTGTPTSACPDNYEDFICWVLDPIEGVRTTKIYDNMRVSGNTAAKSDPDASKQATYTFYAAFGKVETESSDVYTLVEEDQTDWSGDYLIAYSDEVFMDGSLNGGKDVGKVGAAQAHINPETALSEDKKSVDATWGNAHHLTIEAIDDKDLTKGYVLKTNYTGVDATPYIYQSIYDNGMAGNANKSTAKNNPIFITFESSTDVKLIINTGTKYVGLRYNNTAGSSGEMFRFYKDAGQKAVYLYKRIFTPKTYSAYITTCPTFYDITIDDQIVGGEVTADPNATIDAGATIQLTATASAGYTAEGGTWTVTNETTTEAITVNKNNQFTMPASDVTVSYAFVALVDNFQDALHGAAAQTGVGAQYDLPTLANTTEGTRKDAFFKFAGWVSNDTEITTGEPATAKPTILEGKQDATGATYKALWANATETAFVTEECNTAIPTNLHVVNDALTANSAKLDWNNVTNATKYHVSVYQATTLIVEADVESSEYVATELTMGTEYSFTVKAYNGCWGYEADAVLFTTKAEIASHLVTLVAENGQIEIDPDLTDGKLNEGTVATVTATANDGYYFVDWTFTGVTPTSKEGETATFAMPTKAITITATFAEYPKVTWKMAGQADKVTSSVPDGDKFMIGADNMQPAPATWTFKEYYKEFAGWMTNSDFENPVFATATTEVPADGLVVNGAVAKSVAPDCSQATKITSNENLDMSALYVMGAEYNETTIFYNGIDGTWGKTTQEKSDQTPITFTISGTKDALALLGSDGNYIKGYSSKTFGVSESKAEIVLSAEGKLNFNTSWYLNYNNNGGGGGIRWYKNSDSPAYLYKVGLAYENLTTDPSGTQIRPDAKVGMISGICYERDIVAHSGATFYYLSQKASDESYIELTEVTGILHAGYPYLFEASDNEIRVIFDGEAIEDENAYNYNGLYGTFVDQPLGDGYCIILNNKYYRTHTGNNNGCYNHRAYLKLDEVNPVTIAPGETEEPVNAPRRIRMGGDGVNTPTGFDNIFGNDAEAIQKLIINNQLIIFRQGKRYNAAGALMK